MAGKSKAERAESRLGAINDGIDAARGELRELEDLLNEEQERQRHRDERRARQRREHERNVRLR